MLELEIAVASVLDALTAIGAGADRVELSAALELGGVTPSAGMLDAVLATGAETHVLIRCRPGDFVYAGDEVDTMTDDIRRAVAAGARGVVIGALDRAGGVDLDTLARWADAARTARAGTVVTLHRAIDHTADPVAALRSVRDAGIAPDRVLSSGGAARARDGAAVLHRMAQQGGPQIMAGAGVRADDVAALASAGVCAVHLSARRIVGRASSGPSLGSAGGLDHGEVDAALVAAARRAIDAV